MCGAAKRKQDSRRQFRIRGAAALLSVMLILPAVPMAVHAKEDVYEVQPGDCLWKIAEKYLCDGTRYKDIVEWNKDLIEDPNLIYPGMELRIAADTTPQTEERTSDSTDAGPYQKGTINGNTWESEWIGMQLNLPDYYEFIDVETFFDDVGKDTYIVLPKDSGRHIDWEFVVVDPTLVFSDGYAFVAVEQTDLSVRKYMKEIRKEIEKEVTDGSGVDMSWSDEEKGNIGSLEYYIATVEYAGSKLTQEYYVTKKDDRIVLMCFSVETITFDFPELSVFK